MSHTRIVFLILPRVHMLDLAGPMQVFQEAIDQGADISLEYCSTESELNASSELNINNLQYYSKINFQEGDYLIIPGAEVSYLVSKKVTSDKELLDWTLNAHTTGAWVCSVCTGAFFLAAAGLLNGRKCTTHWKRTTELKTRYPAIKLQEDILFTEHDRIYTSAGVTAGIDLALFIVEKLTSENISYKTARELVVYLRRSGSESQQSIFMKHRNHIHTGVHKAQDYLQENIHQKISLDQLAETSCMSARNLTRAFKKETGITVNEYVTLIRKSLLQEFTKDPNMSRKQMARQCGLKSERQVIRLLQTI
jgi:transcriptional regulator GlxA family with amidase domain